MTIVFGVGIVLLMRRFLLGRPDQVPLLLIGGIFAPAVLASFVSSYFESRYFFYLYPLIVIVFAMAIIELLSPFLKRFAGGRRGARSLAAIGLGVGILFFSQDANPLRAWNVSNRTYDSRKDPVRSVISWQLYADFHQDHEGPSSYARQHMGPDDTTVALGPIFMLPNYHFYVGTVDYAVVPVNQPDYYGRIRNGRMVNYVTGSELLAGLPGLQRTIDQATGPVWLLADRKLLLEENRFYSEPLKEFLRGPLQDPDYVGRDGQTIVKRIPITTTPPR